MILDENLFNDVNDINLVESFNIVADGYAPNEYDKEWAIDDINNVRVNINDVIEYHVNEDADYFILTFKDGTKKAWYIHSGMYIPDKDFEESLKEAGTQNDLLRTAVQDAYGFNKKEADTYIVNADEKTKEEILRGFTNNAKKNFYDESLKETFEDEYNNCFVELCDGKPQFAYDKYKDASQGVFSSKMGDSQFGTGVHEYTIKYFKDGTYYDVDDDGNPVGLENESLKETFISSDKRWEIAERVKRYIDEGHINKDDLINILLQWYYQDSTFIPCLISNKIISEEEIDDIVYDESLKEDFDEVVAIEVPDVNVEIEAEETKPEGPAPGADTGITDLLLSLINDENSTIQTYNSFKASLEDHADFDDVINDIVAEEYNHVGMLQTLLKKISPNSVTIDAGEEEAEDILTKEDNDSLEYGEIIGEIDDSFDNGFGGIFA